GGLVAEEDGDIVGVGWLHPRGAVATIGPVAVDPRNQGRGIGRRIIERLVDLAGRSVAPIPLGQEGYHTGSLGLYLRAGFPGVAPLLDLELPPAVTIGPPRVPPGLVLRTATGEDRARVAARDARAFGAQRSQSIDLYLGRGRVLVAEAGSALVGYAMGI